MQRDVRSDQEYRSYIPGLFERWARFYDPFIALLHLQGVRGETVEMSGARMLVTYLFEHYKHCAPDLTKGHFEGWRRGLHNWEMTDGLGWVMALWLLGDPDTRLDYLWELIADEDVWSRRLALVATTPINRGHTGFTIPDLTLELVDRAKAERHPMITKAVSWALREMTKSHPDQVAAYLEENREVLASHVVREVSNKLRTGLKSGKASSGVK
jgi:3-methyladenine DNA glycosylase AlkD